MFDAKRSTIGFKHAKMNWILSDGYKTYYLSSLVVHFLFLFVLQYLFFDDLLLHSFHVPHVAWSRHFSIFDFGELFGF